MMSRASTPAPSLAEIEEALTVAAYLVLRHGEAYAPVMERLERELDQVRRRAPSTDRARRILNTLPAAGRGLITSAA